MQTNPLSPARFLSLIWPSKLLTNETFELRLIRRTDKTIRRFFFTSIKEFLQEAQRHQGFDVYFGVATRFGSHGKKHDCYRVKTLWTDLDKRKYSAGDFYQDPDVVVDSGGGTHAYWFLTSPVLVRGERSIEIESYNRGITQELKGDDNCCDVSRILRVPGFLNYKYNPPRIVRAYSMVAPVVTDLAASSQPEAECQLI